ncbi:tyrosine-protein phosphatase [Loktanella sp. DJP18]|uniref:tyrosine-protein phosphatase n=1 Tax=Loktanella sp. DJP18 TaxID=3409788 RepID=UPI003BB5A448
MLRRIVTALTGRDRPKRVYALDTPGARRRSWLYYQFVDHGFLRYRWTNFDLVAPGVYRSNHPHATRLDAYRTRGIRAILNLRGVGEAPPYLMEVEACHALGLDLVSVKFAARNAPARAKLLELFAAFDTVQRPFVMHCKSGADRAGLASALYLLDQGAPMAEARRHLSLRYLHLKWTKTGVQDALLDLYEARLARGPITLRDWVRDEYDPDAVRALFASRRSLPL